MDKVLRLFAFAFVFWSAAATVADAKDKSSPKLSSGSQIKQTAVTKGSGTDTSIRSSRKYKTSDQQLWAPIRNRTKSIAY